MNVLLLSCFVLWSFELLGALMVRSSHFGPVCLWIVSPGRIPQSNSLLATGARVGLGPDQIPF